MRTKIKWWARIWTVSFNKAQLWAMWVFSADYDAGGHEPFTCSQKHIFKFKKTYFPRRALFRCFWTIFWKIPKNSLWSILRSKVSESKPMSSLFSLVLRLRKFVFVISASDYMCPDKARPTPILSESLFSKQSSGGKRGQVFSLYTH